MKNPFSKVPFLFLLIPLIAGILVQYYLHIEYLSIAFLLTGAIAMLFSYLLPEKRQFNLRWLFGAGTFIFVIGIAIISTDQKQNKSDYNFTQENKTYRGIISDSPQNKPKTTAYKVFLPNENKQIICYIKKDSLDQTTLQPGDEIIFRSKIQPFKNIGDSNRFDYARYMYNQGYVGSSYLPNSSWETTTDKSYSIEYIALGVRIKVMNFYKSLGLNQTEYSLLSALTLGYQNELPEELIQGFRTTGTVHVLSVSGLHVGIIYLMINFILCFIRKGSKYYFIKPLLTIILLWAYAFITGLPPSVIRASAMLTVFCVSEIAGRRNDSQHSLFIAAFFILLIDPFSIFDIGFQLSFMSVLGILYLHPKVSAIVKTKNKYLRYIWQMIAISLVAQLATFPICFYYFGTFPTYFFVTNLLIIPIVTLTMYSVGFIFTSKAISLLIPDLGNLLLSFSVKCMQILIEGMTLTIQFFEKLPFALIENVQLSLLKLICLYAIIVSFIVFLIYRSTKALIAGLIFILLLLVCFIFSNLETKSKRLSAPSALEKRSIT